MKHNILKLFSSLTSSFLYVDCGARGESQNPLVDGLPQASYIGFDPDPEECARLAQLAKANYQYFPVALGKRAETRTLYITQNPACSSLLAPNYAFWSEFQDCASQIMIAEKREIQVTTIDAYLPTQNIHQLDFLELDTQGTELEILQGAAGFLSSSILGIRVEVEFSPMYEAQPLFAEVDSYLRQFGFMVFDLSRHYYRRQNYPLKLNTRGQLLYGHAVYLKQYQRIPVEGRSMMRKLAAIAVFYGFHDYAIEILDALLHDGTGGPDLEERRLLEYIRAQYMDWLASKSHNKHRRFVRLFLWLENARLQGLSHKIGTISASIADAYSFVHKRSKASWND